MSSQGLIGHERLLVLALFGILTLATGFVPIVERHQQRQSTQFWTSEQVNAAGRSLSSFPSRLYSVCKPKDSSTDFYDILGVDPFAKPKEIKSAYRQLVKRHHPDANHTGENKKTTTQDSEKFREISRAYEVLIDPSLRKRYDKYGEIGLRIEDTSSRYVYDVRDSNVPPRRRKRYMFDEQSPVVGEAFSFYSSFSYHHQCDGKDGLPLTSSENGIDFMYIGQQDYFQRDPSITRLDSTACQFQDMLKAKPSKNAKNFEEMGIKNYESPLFPGDIHDPDDEEVWGETYSNIYMEDQAQGHHQESQLPPPRPRYRQPKRDVRFRPYDQGQYQSVKRSTSVSTRGPPVQVTTPFFAKNLQHAYHDDDEEEEQMTGFPSPFFPSPPPPPPPVQTGYGPSLFSQTAAIPMIQRRSTELSKQHPDAPAEFNSYSP
ncbi:hypothetical protein ACA910_016138 [Epithemia clementina (nom. ined.)]